MCRWGGGVHDALRVLVILTEKKTKPRIFSKTSRENWIRKLHLDAELIVGEEEGCGVCQSSQRGRLPVEREEAAGEVAFRHEYSCYQELQEGDWNA